MTRYLKWGDERTKIPQAGFTLFIAVITISIVLAIGISILNITLKEYLLSGLARDSEIAYYAADAGLECFFYWDFQGYAFQTTATDNTTVTCMGESEVMTPRAVGDPDPTHAMTISWGDSGAEICAIVELTKYDSAHVQPGFPSCDVGELCTYVLARGYNRACDDIDSDPKTVERALFTSY